ncbi:MAG TPA: histidine kinase [Egicoccus sp.]|nr:histidine kinase [Egicoccus sp.]HSK22989.1 histidine kinase [Egicoccus sp.]
MSDAPATADTALRGGPSGLRPDTRTLLVDTAVAVLLAALVVVGTWLNAQAPGMEALQPSVWTYLSGAVLCLALALRRRAPLTGLVVCGFAFGWFRMADGIDAGASSAALFLALVAAGIHGAAPWRNRLRGAVVAGMMALVLWNVVGQAEELAEFPAVLALQSYMLAFNVFFFAAAWVLGDQMRLRRSREADLASRTAELTTKTLELEQERQRTAEQAATEERLRLARELHDVLGHHVSVMGVQAAAARRVLARDPDRATDALASIEGSSRQAVAELQRVLKLLRADDRDAAGGLRVEARLDALARELRAAGLAVTLQVEDLPELPTEIDLALGRVVQESLTNALRHAGPGTSTWVRLWGTRTGVEVEIVDDAHGDPLPDEGRFGSGSGLTGMRERVELHGGRFRAGPTAPRGYRVHAWLPLPGGTGPAEDAAVDAVGAPTAAGG